METLNTLVELLKLKAKKTTEDHDLLEFEKGKYFFGVVKNYTLSLHDALRSSEERRVGKECTTPKKYFPFSNSNKS